MIYALLAGVALAAYLVAKTGSLQTPAYFNVPGPGTYSYSATTQNLAGFLADMASLGFAPLQAPTASPVDSRVLIGTMNYLGATESIPSQLPSGSQLLEIGKLS